MTSLHHIDSLRQVKRVWHFMAEGPFSFLRNERDDVLNVRQVVFANHGIELKDVVIPDMVHGSKVLKITKQNASNVIWQGGKVGEGDALITSSPLVALCLLTADCLPLFFVDETKGVIALAHAGWQGTQKRIALAVVKTMTKKPYLCKKENIKVFGGPSVGPCCYKVTNAPDDRIKLFTEQFENDPVAQDRDGEIYLDLRLANSIQLMAVDIPVNNIHISDRCTCCTGLPSHYRDGEKRKDSLLSCFYLVN